MHTRDLVAALLLVLGIGTLAYAQKESSLASTSVATSTDATLAEVASHNNRESCWSVINGSTYDLTSWIPQHPGGEQAILGLCGTDGSAKFNGQHGGSARQEAILTGFRIAPADGNN